MARKLSEIRRCVMVLFAAAGALLATSRVCGEEAPTVAATPVIVQNPFTARASRSTPPTDETEPQDHAGTVYRNPFASGPTAPPIGHPMLGPVSRWRGPAAPLEEPSAVKAAILSAALMEDIRILGDQRSRVDTLADHSLPRTPHFVPSIRTILEPPEPVRFAEIPLAQPTSLLPDAERLVAVSPVGQASFDQPIPLSEAAPVMITDMADMADSQACLEQAREAASAAQSLDDFSAVAGLCQRGLAAEPSIELATSLRQLAAWAHNRRGELLADCDRPQEAIAAFRFAISLDANCSQAIHNRAVSLTQQNQFAAALGDFNRVIELNPGLAVAYRNRAELLAALGRMREAVTDYSRAIESIPQDAELYAARGYAWQRLGDFDRAAADYDRALQMAPGETATIAQRGNLAAQRGDYDRALADFRQAVAIDADCAGAHRSMAWLYATCSDERFRDAEQALASARLAVALSAPDDFLALEAMAAALAAAGQYEEAVRIQQQAIGIAPPDSLEPLRQRLAIYKSRQPFVSGPGDATIRAEVATPSTSRPGSPRPRAR